MSSTPLGGCLLDLESSITMDMVCWKLTLTWLLALCRYAWHIIFGEPVKIQALDEHDLYTPIDPARDSTRRMLASKRVRVGAT